MKLLATALLMVLTISLKAQTIFNYGNDAVSREEFMRAWHKNNTGEKSEKAFREYLDLYINSRLKIKEAKEKGYDTLPQIVADLNNLRQQILPAYLVNKEATNKLVNEAFERSQKDLHMAHIFISASPANGTDPKRKKAEEALEAIRNGKDFEAVARQYSEDPSVQSNGGDMGWITVFSLPYELEHIAYTTPVGRYSDIFQSSAGYHILKNLGERRARGKMKAAQILLAFPPDADEKTREEIKNRADSVYIRLQKGDDFGQLAALLSNDVVSAAANGQMQVFGIGQYDIRFENAAFELNSDGAYTKPFLTGYGYHIVKRISKTPPPAKLNDEYQVELQAKVEISDRMNKVRRELIRSQMKDVKITGPAFDHQTLWAYSDSVLNYQPPGKPIPIQATSVLMQVGDKKITAADWISFAQAFRYKTDGSGLKTYSQLFDEFVEALAIDYYQNHLEDFNEEFARQLQEFKEGNLFFEIMQKEVWGPAQTDTASLRKFFNENRSGYHWKPGADAVVFYATDEASAKEFRDQLIKAPAEWNRLTARFSDNVAADSSRFELSQIPNPSKQKLKPGSITSLLVNKMDQSTSFAYIIMLHNKTEPRRFEESRGMVINDYQAELEKNWLAELKKKYPVKLNTGVIEQIVKEKSYR